MGEIIALTRMSEGEYDAARAVIGNRKDAKANWDQELCKLFNASGWTTETLARKEGIRPRTMQQRLLFGRFLTFAEKRAATRAHQCLNGLPHPSSATSPPIADKARPPNCVVGCIGSACQS